MSISHFAQLVNLPLCSYFDSIPYDKANQEKEPLYFVKGDPSGYNNPNFKVPEQVYEIMRKHFQSPTNHGYTLSSGIPAARQAISKLYNPKFNIGVNHVVVQHGAHYGLLSALLAFTNPGDQILVPEFGYPFFQNLAPALRIEIKKYKFKQNYELDLESIKSNITEKTQFLFIVNPMNPTGTIFSLKHMKEILTFCDQNQLPIVADEVYHGQNYPSEKFYSFGDVTQDVPVIVVSGVQKIFMTPGWCTSWSVVFDKHNYLQTVWRNVLTFGTIVLHSNKPTQMALPELIEKKLYLKQQNYAKVQKIQTFLFQQFSKLECFTPLKAQGTIYETVFLNIDKFKDIENQKDFIQKLLVEENICVIPLSIMGGDRPGFRIIACAEKQTYDHMFERLTSFYERHKK